MALFTTILVALSPLLQPAEASKPVEPVVSSPSPGEKVLSAARDSEASPHISPAATTPALASWYPGTSACWDSRGRHAVTASVFTAHPSLPCGTMLTVDGPAGSVTLPVEDHGPEAWTGRGLDLSPAAFEAVAGRLDVGVIPVEWRPAA